jgi:hypothetical protein
MNRLFVFAAALACGPMFAQPKESSVTVLNTTSASCQSIQAFTGGAAPACKQNVMVIIPDQKAIGFLVTEHFTDSEGNSQVQTIFAARVQGGAATAVFYNDNITLKSVDVLPLQSAGEVTTVVAY